ncbi:MAG: transposase [Chlamydiae bacterium]|nr:transposase [Chlamydiota bacterium]
MTRKYNSYTAEFKLKIALEASKNEKTINQIASENGVSPSQVAEWKKTLLAEGSSLFQNKRTIKKTEAHEDVGTLQQQVDKLTVRIDWLKKKLGISS